MTKPRSRRRLVWFLVKGLIVAVTLMTCVACQMFSSGKSSSQDTPAGPGNLTLSSTTINFGDVAVARTQTETITASNSGGSSVTISSATSSGAEFVVASPTLPATVAAGGSVTLSISFTPSDATAHSGTISITSNAVNSSVTVSLSGTGVPPGQFTSNVNSLNFAGVEVGSTQTEPVILTASGEAPVTVSKATVTGAGFSLSGVTLPLVVDGGKSATVEIAFTPQSASLVNGSIVFTTNASNATTSVTLSAAGTIPATYFGQNPYYGVERGQVPWPDFAVGTMRLWGTTTVWTDLEPTEGSFVWDTAPTTNVLDTWLNMGQAQGMTDFIYTFGKGTPDWISSNPNDKVCDKPGYTPTPGWCDPPLDVNPDGSGTDAAFKAFVTALVQHAAGRIKTWECINEPDVAEEWNGTTAQVLTMCTDMYNIVKSIDPTAKVTTPSSTGAGYLGSNGQAVTWMTTYLQMGGGNFADIIAFHGYFEPTTSPEGKLIGLAQGITGAAAGVKETQSKPVWDTEMGYADTDFNADPDMQASFVARSYLLQWSFGVSRFYWYSYGSPITGTIWTSSGDLPAAVAYGVVDKWMVGSSLTSPCAGNGNVWSCGFRDASGGQTLAVWDVSQTCSAGACTTSSYVPDASYSKYEDLTGNTTSFTPGTAIQLGVKPILLEQ